MNTYTLDIRDRRQVTFPSELLKLLGIGIGDSVEIQVKDKSITLKPKVQIALEALAELQTAFQKSRISEKVMLTNVSKLRLQKAKNLNDQT